MPEIRILPQLVIITIKIVNMDSFIPAEKLLREKKPSLTPPGLCANKAGLPAAASAAGRPYPLKPSHNV